MSGCEWWANGNITREKMFEYGRDFVWFETWCRAAGVACRRADESRKKQERRRNSAFVSACWYISRQEHEQENGCSALIIHAETASFVWFFVLFFYSRERESDTMIEIEVRDSSSFFLAEVQGGVWPSVRFYSQLASADEMHTLSNNQTNTSRRDETDLASCCQSRCLYKQQAELKCDGPVLFSFLMRKPRSRERGLIWIRAGRETSVNPALPSCLSLLVVLYCRRRNPFMLN